MRQKLNAKTYPGKTAGRNGSTAGTPQPARISGNVEPPQENWSRADDILKRAQQSRLQSRGRMGTTGKSTSPFSREDIKQASKSRSGIFPGERSTTNGTKLSDLIGRHETGREGLGNGISTQDEREAAGDAGSKVRTRGTQLSDVLGGRTHPGQQPTVSLLGKSLLTGILHGSSDQAEGAVESEPSPEPLDSETEATPEPTDDSGGYEYEPKPEETPSSNNNNNPFGDFLEGAAEATGDAFDNTVDSLEESEAELNEVLDEVEAEINDAVDEAETEANEVIDEVEAEINDAIDEAEAEINEVLDEVEAEINDTVDEAEAEFNEVLDEVEAEINDAVDEAEAVAKEVIDSANQKAEELKQGVEQRSEEFVDNAEQAIDQANQVGSNLKNEAEEAFDDLTYGEDGNRNPRDGADDLIELLLLGPVIQADAARRDGEVDLLEAPLVGAVDALELGLQVLDPQKEAERREEEERRQDHKVELLLKDIEIRQREREEQQEREQSQAQVTDDGITARDVQAQGNNQSGKSEVQVRRPQNSRIGSRWPQPRQPQRENDDALPRNPSIGIEVPDGFTPPNDFPIRLPLDPGYNRQPGQHDKGRGKAALRDIIGGILDRLPSGGGYVESVAYGSTSVRTTQPDDSVVESDVPRIRTDLEIVDIRFLDLGSVAEQTGPRFRITVQNHNNKFAAENVEVALIAAIELADESAEKSVVVETIEAIAPQATAHIDIRLSRDVFQLAQDDKGQPIAFSQLAVVADPDGQFDDVQPDNNILVQGVDEIPYAELKLFELVSTKLTPGAEIVLAGEGFQFDQGAVALVINKKPYPMTVSSWSPVRIVARVPQFKLSRSVPANLVVVCADKSITKPQLVQLAP